VTMFPHTLWHGTSAHLLPMIDKYGLGGRNVLAGWRVMEFLQWAFPQLGFDDQNYSDPDYLELLPIQAAARGGADGMNFVYGDVYATGGYDKAASYAQTAPELLSFARTVVEVAERKGLESIADGLKRYVQVADFLNGEPKPVVLKLPPVPISSVRMERGGDVPIDMLADSPVLDELISQLAFRVEAVIPLSEIEVLDANQKVSIA
jgi:hypothetical protein